MMVSNEMKDYCRGMYGMPPGPVAPELLSAALGGETPSTKKPADMLAPGFETARLEAGTLARTEEDVLTYALFPTHAPEFLRAKYNLSSTGGI